MDVMRARTLTSSEHIRAAARLGGAFGLAMLAAACATTQSSAPVAGPATAEFRTSDFNWSTTAGQGRIDGQLKFKAGNTTYSCVDAGVILTPETPWTRRRMEILYKSPEYAALPAAVVRARTPPGRSSDYSAFVKRTACDASGRFTFDGLPDGAWFVITVARPAAGPGQEVAIMRRAKVQGGRVVAVRL